MLDEWSKYNNENPTENKSPSIIFNNDYNDYEYYIKTLETTIPKDEEILQRYWIDLEN